MQLVAYENKERAWRKRRNVLDCKIRRRNKVLRTLKAVTATFEEDTKSDGEHAQFVLKKLEGIPREIFENEMKNRERDPGGRRYNPKLKEFALTLYYYSPRAYDFCRLASCS